MFSDLHEFDRNSPIAHRGFLPNSLFPSILSFLGPSLMKLQKNKSFNEQIIKIGFCCSWMSVLAIVGSGSHRYQ